jgi:hypothetical protein
MAFAIRLADGSTVRTCCPRCGLHFLHAKNPTVARLEVRDFDTAKALEARAAIYVEGSDVHPCSVSLEGGPRDERGCCLSPVYDRCLPSVVAFAEPSRAKAFAHEHGGTLTTFAALEERVK